MRIKKIHGEGNHLIVDGISEGELNNTEFIKGFLASLVKEIKMQAISEPFVLKYDAEDANESGVTGTIILAESSLTIHTYPEKKTFFLDIFSCKEFDVENALGFIRDILKVSNYKKQLLRRGIYNETN